MLMGGSLNTRPRMKGLSKDGGASVVDRLRGMQQGQQPYTGGGLLDNSGNVLTVDMQSGGKASASPSYQLTNAVPTQQQQIRGMADLTQKIQGFRGQAEDRASSLGVPQNASPSAPTPPNVLDRMQSQYATGQQQLAANQPTAGSQYANWLAENRAAHESQIRNNQFALTPGGEQMLKRFRTPMGGGALPEGVQLGAQPVQQAPATKSYGDEMSQRESWFNQGRDVYSENGEDVRVAQVPQGNGKTAPLYLKKKLDGSYALTSGMTSDQRKEITDRNSERNRFFADAKEKGMRRSDGLNWLRKDYNDSQDMSLPTEERLKASERLQERIAAAGKRREEEKRNDPANQKSGVASVKPVEIPEPKVMADGSYDLVTRKNAIEDREKMLAGQSRMDVGDLGVINSLGLLEATEYRDFHNKVREPKTRAYIDGLSSEDRLEMARALQRHMKNARSDDKKKFGSDALVKDFLNAEPEDSGSLLSGFSSWLKGHDEEEKARKDNSWDNWSSGNIYGY